MPHSAASSSLSSVEDPRRPSVASLNSESAPISLWLRWAGSVVVLACLVWVARAATESDGSGPSSVPLALESGDGAPRKLSRLEAFIEGLCEGSGEKCYLEKVEYEAIKALHRQLDDDADGDVDISESTDFLREELQYEGGSSVTRQQAFHQNDKHISVDDLWRTWIHSEVHNWTAEQTGQWLVDNVGLEHYADTFLTFQINGSLLPTLATNSRFMSDVLGIRDPIHRQKLSLKAMDVVLFGPPKERHHIWKESVLLFLLFVTLACYWYAYQQNQRSQSQLKRMMKDMESLSKAEKALANMQKELSQSKEEEEQAERNKRSDLEKKIRREITQKCALGGDSEIALEEQVSRLKEELTVVRSEWERAEQELSDRCWFAPPELQNWLQLTFEIESRYFNAKKAAAQSQLSHAKDACEKLKKRRSNFIGSFVSTHGKNIDEVDTTILQARTALIEVTNDLQERMHRWQEIERLCNSSIINNPGYNYLDMLMRGGSSGASSTYAPSVASKLNGSHYGGDDDDDAASVFAPSVVERLVWTSAPMFIHPVHGPTGTGSGAGATPRAGVYRRKKSFQTVMDGAGAVSNGGLHASTTQIGFDVLCNGPPHVRAAAVPNGGDALTLPSGFPHSKSTNALLANAGGSVSVLPRRSPSTTVLDQMSKDPCSDSEAGDDFPAAIGDDDDDLPAHLRSSLTRSSRRVAGPGFEVGELGDGGGGGVSFLHGHGRPISAVGLTRRLRMSNKSLSHDTGAGAAEPAAASAGVGSVASAIHGREQALLQQSPSKSYSESALDARIRGAAVAVAVSPVPAASPAASSTSSTPPPGSATAAATSGGGSPAASRRFPGQQSFGVPAVAGAGLGRSPAAGDGAEVLIASPSSLVGDLEAKQRGTSSSGAASGGDDSPPPLDPKSPARRSKKSLFSKLAPSRHR